MGPIVKLVGGPLDGQLKEWVPERPSMQFAEWPPMPEHYVPGEPLLVEPLKHHTYVRDAARRDQANYYQPK